MKPPIECPVCHAELKQVDEMSSETIHTVSKTGKVRCDRDHDNSGGYVSCSADDSHELSEELVDEVIKRVDKFRNK
jgi:hypothetical protein